MVRYQGDEIMQIKGTIIVFKSKREYFHKEKEGQKPNTFRKLDPEEQKQLINSRLKWISIVNPETGESFLRQLSDISKIDDCFIFSWVPHEKPSPIEYFSGFCFMKVESLSHFDK